MTNYYKEYGKIIVAKDTVLYHWTDNIISNSIYNNSFFCLTNELWSSKNKILYTYKLKKPLELLLTIRNINIIEHQLYNIKDRHNDKEVLTTIYNKLYGKECYNIDDDVILKMDNTVFRDFCNKLKNKGYNGLFNYIDRCKGQFEIVIFLPNAYLEYISCEKYNENNLHISSYHNKIMLSATISCKYYYHYKFVGNYEEYPSIFYYIYVKQLLHKLLY